MLVILEAFLGGGLGCGLALWAFFEMFDGARLRFERDVRAALLHQGLKIARLERHLGMEPSLPEGFDADGTMRA